MNSAEKKPNILVIMSDQHHAGVMGNAGNPIISVVDANHGNRSELLLQHTHQGADLRLDWAKEVTKALSRVWTRPVEVHTIVDEKPTALRYDGRDYAQTAL